MVFLLTLLCLHVECLKLYFLGHLKLEKIQFWKKIKRNLSLCWVIFLLLSPQDFFVTFFCFVLFFSDYRISICLMSKKLRTQEWNEMEYQTLLNKTGIMLGIWDIYIFINISNYVWYYMFLIEQYIVNIIMCYMKFKPIKKKRFLLLSPINNCLSLVLSEAGLKTRFQCNILSGRWFQEILGGVWGSDKGEERQSIKIFSYWWNTVVNELSPFRNLEICGTVIWSYSSLGLEHYALVEDCWCRAMEGLVVVVVHSGTFEQ